VSAYGDDPGNHPATRARGKGEKKVSMRASVVGTDKETARPTSPAMCRGGGEKRTRRKRPRLSLGAPSSCWGGYPDMFSPGRRGREGLGLSRYRGKEKEGSVEDPLKKKKKKKISNVCRGKEKKRMKRAC